MRFYSPLKTSAVLLTASKHKIPASTHALSGYFRSVRLSSLPDGTCAGGLVQPFLAARALFNSRLGMEMGKGFDPFPGGSPISCPPRLLSVRGQERLSANSEESRTLSAAGNRAEHLPAERLFIAALALRGFHLRQRLFELAADVGAQLPVCDRPASLLPVSHRLRPVFMAAVIAPNASPVIANFPVDVA